MNRTVVMVVGLWACLAGTVLAQDAKESWPATVRLWQGEAPRAEGKEESDIPTLRPYPAENGQSGAAVIVCPGGGYGVLAYDHEGHQVAKFFARHGVNAFVLRYRHAPKYRHPTPLEDAQRALRFVRFHAQRYAVDPQRVGIMGFSAGGHLASTAATHFDLGKADSEDPIDRLSCRPDFAVLCYPVISFTAPWSHRGSRRNLLGDRNDDEELAKSLSNELQVTKDTPRTFLFHTAKDTGVPVQNSLAFFTAMQQHGVPGELHAYQHGPHGVGLGHADPVLSGWPDRLMQWMRASNLLSPVERARVQGSIRINGEPLGFGAVCLQAAGDDGQWRASGWAMVRRGKFTIPEDVGPAVGKCVVKIVNWGAVVPRPTLPDAMVSTGITVQVQPGKNEFKFEIEGP